MAAFKTWMQGFSRLNLDRDGFLFPDNQTIWKMSFSWCQHIYKSDFITEIIFNNSNNYPPKPFLAKFLPSCGYESQAILDYFNFQNQLFNSLASVAQSEERLVFTWGMDLWVRASPGAAFLLLCWNLSVTQKIFFCIYLAWPPGLGGKGGWMVHAY